MCNSTWLVYWDLEITKDRMLNQAVVHLQVSVLAFLGVWWR